MRAAAPDRAGRDVRLVLGAALLVSHQLYFFPAVAPAEDVVFAADVRFAGVVFGAAEALFAGDPFVAAALFFAGVVDVVAAAPFFAGVVDVVAAAPFFAGVVDVVAAAPFFAGDVRFAGAVDVVAAAPFFAGDLFVAAAPFFAGDHFVAAAPFFACDVRFAGAVDVVAADAFFAWDPFVAAAPFFAGVVPFPVVLIKAFVVVESSLLVFSADDVSAPWELDPATLRRSEPGPREPSPVCCPDNAPIADTPDPVTERTADDPRICARRSSRSADSRSSAARARSRSAADTRPARSTAFSTSDRTMARRLARFAVAAARISSANAVTCAPIEVDVMLVGRLRTAPAASRARARESSASPEASWR